MSTIGLGFRQPFATFCGLFWNSVTVIDWWSVASMLRPPLGVCDEVSYPQLWSSIFCYEGILAYGNYTTGSSTTYQQTVGTITIQCIWSWVCDASVSDIMQRKNIMGVSVAQAKTRHPMVGKHVYKALELGNGGIRRTECRKVENAWPLAPSQPGLWASLFSW